MHLGGQEVRGLDERGVGSWDEQSKVNNISSLIFCA